MGWTVDAPHAHGLRARFQGARLRVEDCSCPSGTFISTGHFSDQSKPPSAAISVQMAAQRRRRQKGDAGASTPGCAVDSHSRGTQAASVAPMGGRAPAAVLSPRWAEARTSPWLERDREGADRGTAGALSAHTVAAAAMAENKLEDRTHTCAGLRPTPKGLWPTPRSPSLLEPNRDRSGIPTRDRDPHCGD